MTEKTAIHLVNPRLPNAAIHHRFQGWREMRIAAPMFVQEAMEMLDALPEAAADGLWCAHLLPQLHASKLPGVLAQMRRLLRPDGLFITVALDGEIAARRLAQGKGQEPLPWPQERILPLEALYGRDGEYRNCFTAASLGRALRDAGLRNVQVTRESIFLWASAEHQPSIITPAADKIRLTDTHNPGGVPDYLDAPPQPMDAPR